MRFLIATVIASGAIAYPASGAVLVRGSAEQVQVTGARPGTALRLVDRRGHVVARRRAGSLGGSVFRGVKAAGGYRLGVGTGRQRSRPFSVMTADPSPPSPELYAQGIPAKGYGYLTTRDGTKLAIDVRLPAGGAGPYPTLVEYSGYGYARPSSGQSSIAALANLLGFAVVDVNMRGTGCSGGAFDYFERLQALDGYDVIETVARQPWVMHHRVGMMGISYGGISQLFVAATNPPSLAAIAPLSVLDDTATTLYPGGILNTGFALAWSGERDHDAKPASATGGQPWALERIRGGDATCKANQALHPEAVNLVAKSRANHFYVPSVADPVAPRTFVNKITAPVFLACQWTDEQTGGHCPTLAARFTGTRRKWFTFTNGTHIDSLDPATLTRWFDFLSLYVAQRAPRFTPEVRNAGPLIFKTAMGVDGVALPDDPIQAKDTYEDALAAFEALPAVRVMFDNGAGSTPGAPVAGFERSYDSFPPPGTAARSWYLSAGGSLQDAAPTQDASDTFAWSTAGRPATSFTGDTSSGPGGLWTATPSYRWLRPPPGTALGYETAPLTADVGVVGGGAVQGWVRSSAPDVDLQVTVSEVRPDGLETFVQNGWLRASRRRLDPTRSTLLEPVPSLRRADVVPLPKGQWSPVSVPLYYQGHVYRSGSRIRLTISAPGGDQPVWAFAETVPHGPASVGVARSPARASRLVLPVVPGLAADTPLPPCPALRGQPCRSARP